MKKRILYAISAVLIGMSSVLLMSSCATDNSDTPKAEQPVVSPTPTPEDLLKRPGVEHNQGITGYVLDEISEPVADVTVKFLLENEETKTVMTEETGMFFADLPVGIYDIEISKEAYNITTAKGFRLEADKLYTLPTNLTLRKPNPVYQQLPEEFVYSDDSGNWATTVRIKSDGRFTGESYVKNLEETDIEYPDGTIYECDFQGRFLAPKEVEPGIYSVSLDHYSHSGTSGETSIENQQRHIITDYPNGMKASIRFMLYFPGTSTEKLPDTLGDLISRYHMGDTIPANHYILYSEEDFAGFVGIIE